MSAIAPRVSILVLMDFRLKDVRRYAAGYSLAGVSILVLMDFRLKVLYGEDYYESPDAFQSLF